MRRTLQIVSASLLALISFWNIWVFDRAMSDFPARTAEAVFVREGRYAYIRDALLKIKYTGAPIGFITNRDVQAQPHTPDDEIAWAQAQYIMLPWVVLRDGWSLSGRKFEGGEEAPFVIGDFWDGQPAKFPENLTKIFEAENIVLFRRNLSQ